MMYQPIAVLMLLAWLGIGCESTKHTKDVEASGFLGEHRHLLKSGIFGQEALRVYRNPKADWGSI